MEALLLAASGRIVGISKSEAKSARWLLEIEIGIFLVEPRL
jgi:hypothetical protein